MSSSSEPKPRRRAKVYTTEIPHAPAPLLWQAVFFGGPVLAVGVVLYYAFPHIAHKLAVLW